MVFEFKKTEPFRYGQIVTLPDGRTGVIAAEPGSLFLTVKIYDSAERVTISENDLRKFN